MKKCSRCGTEILVGQLVCPHCGKRQRQPRQARCRHCGTISSRSFKVCPACGEPLQHDWFRPILIGAIIGIGALLGLFVAPWIRYGLSSFRPSLAVSTVQAVASEVPLLVEVPTLTPSLTPSVTPTPTNTPTTTPTPSLTPTPTTTPTPTETPTPTPTETPTETPTPVWPTWTPKPRETPTATPTPTPPVEPPTLAEPEDGAPFNGENAHIKLAWRSGYTLKPDEFYEVLVRYTYQGVVQALPVHVQQTYWYVDEALYLQVDQETDFVYHWSVRLARKETGSDGAETFVPISQPSAEWSFSWK